MKQLSLWMMAVLICWPNTYTEAMQRLSKPSFRFLTRIGFGAIHAVRWSPDGNTLAVAGEAGLHLIPYKNGELIRTRAKLLNHGETNLNSIAFNFDGTRLATAADDRTVRIWEQRDTNWVQSLALREHSGYVYEVAFSPDGTLLASADADMVRVWDARTGRLQRVLAGHSTVAFSPDGLLIAAASEGAELGQYDNAVRLWNVRSGAEIDALRSQTGIVRSLTFSPDGTELVAGGDSGSIRRWKRTASDAKFVLLDSDAGSLAGNILARLRELSYAPDGAFIVGSFALSSGNRHDIFHVWDAEMGKLSTFQSQDAEVNSAAFHPREKVIAVGTGDRLLLWNLTTNKALIEIINPNPEGSMAFSPDGRLLATIIYYDAFALWDVATGVELVTWSASQYGSVTFSPDGRFLASGGFESRQIKVWSIEYTLDRAVIKEVAHFDDKYPFSSIAFTDPQHLIYATNTQIKVVTVLTGQISDTYRHSAASFPADNADSDADDASIVSYTNLGKLAQVAIVRPVQLVTTEHGSLPIYSVALDRRRAWYAALKYGGIWLFSSIDRSSGVNYLADFPRAHPFRGVIFNCDGRLVTFGDYDMETHVKALFGDVLAGPLSRRSYSALAINTDHSLWALAGRTISLWQKPKLCRA